MNIKNSLLCAMAVGAVFASRAEETKEEDVATAGNLTGVMKVKAPTVPGDAVTFDTLLSMPWSDPSAAADDDGNVTNLVKVAGLGAGDELYRYDVTKSGYDVWHVVVDEKTDERRWEPGQTVSGGGTPEIPDAVAKLGTGLILRVHDHGTTNSYVVGAVPTGDTYSVTIPANTDAAVLELISYPWPTSEAMDVNDMVEWGKLAVGRTDQIRYVSPLTANLVSLRYNSTTKKWVGVGSSGTAIPQGCGFWYLRAKGGTEEMTITWKKQGL